MGDPELLALFLPKPHSSQLHYVSFPGLLYIYTQMYIGFNPKETHWYS